MLADGVSSCNAGESRVALARLRHCAAEGGEVARGQRGGKREAGDNADDGAGGSDKGKGRGKVIVTTSESWIYERLGDAAAPE